MPSDIEWETLETTLNGSNCRNAISGWLCNGLGWQSHNTKTSSDNMANALKIPLAGLRLSDGYTFFDRGRYASFWSSTAFIVPSSAYNRYLLYNFPTVYRNNMSKSFGFSVRCLKN